MKEQFKKMRNQANLTQQKAAVLIGVGQSTIAMWESGRCVPRLPMLKKIAKAYDCQVADLLEEVS